MYMYVCVCVRAEQVEGVAAGLACRDSSVSGMARRMLVGPPRPLLPPSYHLNAALNVHLQVCFGFFLMLGTVGWRASLLFVRRIYQARAQLQQQQRCGSVYKRGMRSSTMSRISLHHDFLCF
jgi:hypothetical protein